jgi:hypothetical protein
VVSSVVVSVVWCGVVSECRAAAGSQLITLGRQRHANARVVRATLLLDFNISLYQPWFMLTQ